MNKNDMIKYAAIAGGAYLVYWYLTNYNSTGAVSATNPVSYWSSWFGAATPPRLQRRLRHKLPHRGSYNRIADNYDPGNGTAESSAGIDTTDKQRL